MFEPLMLHSLSPGERYMLVIPADPDANATIHVIEDSQHMRTTGIAFSDQPTLDAALFALRHHVKNGPGRAPAEKGAKA